MFPFTQMSNYCQNTSFKTKMFVDTKFNYMMDSLTIFSLVVLPFGLIGIVIYLLRTSLDDKKNHDIFDMLLLIPIEVFGLLFVLAIIWYQTENKIRLFFGLDSQEYRHQKMYFHSIQELNKNGYIIEPVYVLEYVNAEHSYICDICHLPISDEYQYCLLTKCGHLCHVDCIPVNYSQYSSHQLEDCDYFSLTDPNCPICQQYNTDILSMCPCCDYWLNKSIHVFQYRQYGTEWKLHLRNNMGPGYQLGQPHYQLPIQLHEYINQSSNHLSFEILKKNRHRKRNEYNTTDCCICYGTLENRINVLTSCKHIIHNTCFQKWIKVEHSCPICRNNT